MILLTLNKLQTKLVHLETKGTPIPNGVPRATPEKHWRGALLQTWEGLLLKDESIGGN